MAEKPGGMLGLRHAALAVADLTRATTFYRDVLGFAPYYDGDADWTMLRHGSTSVSLVQASEVKPAPTDGSHPAHLGFTFDSPQSVDAFHRQLSARKSVVISTPRWHRDKSYGFYFQDTEGNNLEAIFIPVVPIAGPYAVSEKRGLVLFAHGSSDPAWRIPFDGLLAECRRHFTQTRVTLAFLERATPTLETALEELFHDDSVSEALVVPCFFAAGTHINEDLPRLIEAFRQRFPQAKVQVTSPVGRSFFFQQGMLEAVSDALISYQWPKSK